MYRFIGASCLVFFFQFFFFLWCCTQSGDQLQEDLAKFDYETNKQIWNIRYFALFWLPAKIYYLYEKKLGKKLKICQKFVQKNWWFHSFLHKDFKNFWNLKKLLYHVDGHFFGAKWQKIRHKTNCIFVLYNHSIQRLELAWQLSLANGAAQKKGAEWTINDQCTILDGKWV